MEFRRIVRTAATVSSRPLLSLYPRAPRLFSASALRPNDRNGTANDNTAQIEGVNANADPDVTSEAGGQAAPTPLSENPLSAASIFGTTDLLQGTSLTPRHRTSNYGPSGITAPPIQHLDIKPKMGPTAGRSVVVTTDIAQALMKLKSIISQNRVRQDFHAQKFHERPGLKRKRLASERHRRRFKEGFKRMVSIVMDMKKKGM